MDYEAVKLAKDGHIAIITLNRPERLNAVSPQLTQDFHAALDEVATDEGIRVVILTGEGRGFCSGADVTRMRGRAEGEESQQTQQTPAPVALPTMTIESLPMHIRRIPQPVIGAINGIASGMGLSIALSTDFRVASEEARFASIFIRRSFVPDNGATHLLTHLAGPAIAAEMALTGRIYDAQWGLARGLVNTVVPHGQLMDEARDYAETIASNPPIAVRWTKQLLHRGMMSDLETATLNESGGNRVTTATEDWKEAVKAFVEKRQPTFQGR
jgi:2-(1,2-epoxy-1,2-dihydrophenyl)acetyl-CoA isomerase